MPAALERWRDKLAVDVLHLILMPTERCNFRCGYCYESFEHGRMSAGTVAGVKALLAARAPGLGMLTLDWFGGEPLLAPDVVEEIQGQARELARRHGGLRLRGSMTTNGYLLDREMLERLLGVGVTSFQVSVDGSCASHDRRRTLAGGGPTFHRVWTNLLRSREVDGEFEIIVRIHLDRENLGEVRELVHSCRSAFGGDRRFKLFLRAVSRLGGPNDASLPVLDGDAVEPAVAEARALARRLGLELYDAESEGGGVCYASAGNSFVIRSTGELAKCTVALDHPRNRLGRIRSDGRIELDNAKLTGWMRGLLTGDEEVAACPMKGFAEPPKPGLVAIGG